MQKERAVEPNDSHTRTYVHVNDDFLRLATALNGDIRALLLLKMRRFCSLKRTIERSNQCSRRPFYGKLLSN